MPPPLSRRRIPPQRRFFFGATAISRFALNTPTRRGYFALCAQYTALIGYWLTPIRLLSPYLALYRTQYGLWLRLFRALRSIRLRGAAISRLSPDISHQCPIFLTLRGSKTNHYFDAAHCNIESALQRPSTHSKKICLSTELSNFIQHILRSIFFSFSIFP